MVVVFSLGVNRITPYVFSKPPSDIGSINLRLNQQLGYSVGWNLFRILLAFFDDFTFADSMELRKKQQLGYCRKILTLEVN